MKIVLVTNMPDSSESGRIKTEVEALGHEFDLVDPGSFGFEINGRVVSSPLEQVEADVIIARGILKSIKPVCAILGSLRARGMKVFDNSLLAHRYSIDKVTDILKLALADIPVPITHYSKDFADFPAMAEKIGYPVIVKSTRAGKGVGVYKAENPEELEKLVTDAQKKGKEAKSYLMQEKIPYVHDLRVLIIGKHVYAMKRIPGEGEFRANFSLGGSVELFDLDAPGQALAWSALNAIDMSVGGVDVLITEDNRRYILEVNHTAGFTGMEEATGENIGKIWVEHAIASAV